MTIEDLEKELEKYKTQHTQMIANANAISGAIQAIQALIEKERAQLPKKKSAP